MSLLTKITNALFGQEIERQVSLAVKAYDDLTDRQLSGSLMKDRDRYNYDREEILRDSLEAWRSNPLARRIVELNTQYVVGGGINVECAHEPTHRLLNEIWNHRLNRMSSRVMEWCDELTRTGELFILISTDSTGMSFLRSFPAIEIKEIETRPNDLEQELFYISADDVRYPAYDPTKNQRGNPVMLHYAINRPVGAVRGESDLAPLLKWLSRYSAWLEDRARLNRFRYAFLYTVTMAGSTDAERRARQATLNLNPPTPGSILVKDENETWEALSPKLEAHEAGEDGLAIKRMIAAGAGIPLHFLAEPESSTRTTAEAAGGSTFRHFEQRQEFFRWMIRDLMQVCVARAKAYNPKIRTDIEIKVKCADISSRDNASLAVAATSIFAPFAKLRGMGLIDDAELLRMVYRFSGETTDVEEMLRRGKRAGQLPPELMPLAGGGGIGQQPDNNPNNNTEIKPDGTVAGGKGEDKWQS